MKTKSNFAASQMSSVGFVVAESEAHSDNYSIGLFVAVFVVG